MNQINKSLKGLTMNPDITNEKLSSQVKAIQIDEPYEYILKI